MRIYTKYTLFGVTLLRLYRKKEDTKDNEGDNGEYVVSSGVKNHMEWLPVSGSVNNFFVKLLHVLGTYFSHTYEINIIHRVKKREEQALLYEPTINISFHEE